MRSCDFSGRSSNAAAVGTPAARSSFTSALPAASASSPSVTTKQRGARSGARGTPSPSIASRMRSIPIPNPMPGVLGPPTCSASPS
jgi:hypothetical protein